MACAKADVPQGREGHSWPWGPIRPRQASHRARSDELIERRDFIDGREQSLRPQRIQILLGGFRRVPETKAHRLHGSEEIGPRQMELVRQKLVGMLRFDTPGRQNPGREILEVGGDDEIGPPLDRRRQHVPVVRIRQLQNVYQLLISRDKRITCMRVHQIACPLQPLLGQIGARAQQRVDPFVMNGVRPLGPVEIGDSELEKQVAKRRRVENRSIEKGREAPQGQYPMSSS